MLGLLQLLALGLVVAILFAAQQMVRRLRRPPRRTYAWAVSKGVPGDPGEINPPSGPFTYESFDLGELTGNQAHRGINLWDVTGRAPQGPIVIVTPGWGESRVNGLVRLPALAPLSSRIILWDPRGLGETPGLCALGTQTDVDALRALLAWVTQSPNPRPIILYGWSLGAGVAIAAAAQQPESIAAVLAEAPYRKPWTPAFRVMHLAGLPWRINGPLAFLWLGLRLTGSPRFQGFDRTEHASKLSAPLLVIHGIADEVCPIVDGREIARACPNGRITEIADAGHNDLWTDDRFAPQCQEAIAEFIRSLDLT